MTTLTAGIILVGGRSSRMGRNKALLEYQGAPLFLHMSHLLKRSGVSDVFFSGDVPGGAGCLIEPQAHQGPARALAHAVQQLPGQFSRMLVVPVDMPLLTPVLLLRLLAESNPCSYRDHPLPALLQIEPIPEGIQSMRALLEHQGARVLPLDPSALPALRNINTPEDWAELQQA